MTAHTRKNKNAIVNSLAILIPNYNGESFIVSAVQKFATGFPEVSIVVVDDASTDNSVYELSQTSAHVITRARNGGFAAAVNTGLRFLSGIGCTYVLVANSDVVINEPTCHKIMAELTSTDFLPTDAVFGFLEESKKQFKYDADISGFLFVLRMSILKTVGYLDESFFMYGEEQDYFRRIIEAGFSIRQTHIRVIHKAEGSGTSPLRNSWLSVRNSIWLEVKRFKWWRTCRKVVALFLIINRLYRPSDSGDPSLQRVLRPGVLIGNLYLFSALFWNLSSLFKKIINDIKSKSRS